eukprot:SAG31_NODE_2782_length_5094_cov_57.485285_3_plen_39_part_01
MGPRPRGPAWLHARARPVRAPDAARTDATAGRPEQRVRA